MLFHLDFSIILSIFKKGVQHQKTYKNITLFREKLKYS
ncbi:hypothetical protein THEYE_A0058 [Thermodesulfovibrio yellowstonii DSM 11347]|uniref:Uncharacterized protein n=1 Tax=Thermodesulfovibrio yellowstonii (strain ATCC 51303 / DSM 11347 / YP87) TaxID=289376 RepID=B5YH91_THEYD|nr:hypothetical protein THEYE_A0058 [Thermodesulfovibrio yellowstonii DSM 11347]